MEQWEELTDSKWVLSIVRNGFKIPFKSVPPLSVVPINLSQSSSPLLREEIAGLLKKRAVERVRNPGTPGFFYSRRLANKRSDSQSTSLSPNLLFKRYKIWASSQKKIGEMSRENLKMSDLIPAQFTFIVMEFLTQQIIVKSFSGPSKSSYSDYQNNSFSDSGFGTNFPFSLRKLSAAADLILLGRLHLRPLQICLLSVLKPHILPLDQQVPVTRMLKFHLKRWMNSNRFVQGMPSHHPDR